VIVWNRVLLEKLIMAQLVSEFCGFVEPIASSLFIRG
jgi:hypothetical protein